MDGINLEKLKLEHFRAYQLTRKVAELGLKRDCQKGISSKALSEWLHIIDTAINGERLASGIKYLDLNIAIKELTKMGYVVTESTEDDTARTSLDNGEIKITTEMLKGFYKKVMQENTNGASTSSKN